MRLYVNVAFLPDPMFVFHQARMWWPQLRHKNFYDEKNSTMNIL